MILQMESLNILKIGKVIKILTLKINDLNFLDFDFEKLRNSTTLYVGNLSYYTTETQLFEFFSSVGEVKRIIMGLNKQTKTPCGFCFVE